MREIVRRGVGKLLVINNHMEHKELIFEVRFCEPEVHAAARNALKREPTADELEKIWTEWGTCDLNLKERYRLLESTVEELCDKKHSEPDGGVKK